MNTVLVVDDVVAMADQYAYDLKRVGGYETLVAHGGQAALDALEREAVDCVILDLEMPGMDGFEVLRAMARRGLKAPVIVYTGTGNYDRCTEAIRLGAQSFIDKAEPMERVVQEVEHALERQRLAAQLAALRGRLELEAPLVGASGAMQQLKDAIGRVAKIPSPVLIVGESGSGKELVARALHRLGPHPSGRLSRSTRRRCRRTWWKTSCSVTSAAPSPERAPCARAPSRLPPAEPSFWTRSASLRSPPRRSCCG